MRQRLEHDACAMFMVAEIPGPLACGGLLLMDVDGILCGADFMGMVRTSSKR